MYAGIVDWPWWAYVLAILALTHVTIAAVTIFLHRHQAHRCARPAPSGRTFLSFLAVADHRHGHQGVGVDPSQASRQVRNRRGSAQPAGLRHPPGPVGGGLSLRPEARKPDALQRYGHGTPNDWLENHLYTPWHKLGVVIHAGHRRRRLRRPGRAADVVGASRLDSVLGGRRDQRARAFLGLPQLQPADASTNISPGAS
jgi:stearoyl-CoA desaturase (delta-9 desaturase)